LFVPVNAANITHIVPPVRVRSVEIIANPRTSNHVCGSGASEFRNADFLLDDKIPIDGRFDVVFRALFTFRGSKMQAELLAARLAKDGKGTRFKPGQNYYTIKRDRIAAKLNELVAEYFPNGGYSRMDAARLKLAAQHFVDAETCRDPVVRQRATRCAEYLLAKVERKEEPLLTARELLEQLRP
jgi:hypothetical protein